VVLQLNSEDGKRFHFLQGLPSGYNGKILPGSHAITCIEDFGTMIIQEQSSDLYSISYQCFQFIQPLTLRWRPVEPRPFSCFAIRNDLDEYITGFGPVKIKQGQYNFQGRLVEGGTVSFEKKKVYESLYTGYSPLLMKGIDPSLVTTPQWAGRNLLQWINDIFTNELRADFHIPYYENKVREYLLLQFGTVAFNQPKTDGLLPHEREAVYETLRIISQDMKEHIPIDEIAKRLKLKNFHLKNIFRRAMGMNIYEYQLYKKMMEARDLVLNTDLFEKEIADRLGYSGEASFSTAFLRYFGMRPSQLRKTKPTKE
jgi:AraC-like DNA-binding protein